jgi:secreted trypsin-like serine protease
MVRGVLGAVALVAAMLLSASPADAIAHGTLDGNRHPQTGALIAEFSGGKDVLCSGTLIAPRVFLTAGHCTSFLESRNMTDVWVTFDSEFRASSPLIHGSYVTHPDFGFSGPGGASDPHDQAVVLLDSAATGITPARLPTENFLNTINLRTQRFTAVGYGTVRETKKTGPHAFFFDGIRRFATQSFLSLQPAWLNLSMNPSTGSGGTCFGDSGGPHFLGAGSGETNLLVSLTVTGDSMCRATDKTYRLDTIAARDFLRQYVTLP